MQVAPKNFFKFLILLILITSCGKRFENPISEDLIKVEKTYLSQVSIRITFSEIPSDINIHIPALKYNKDFGFGFHLDDGVADIYTHAFKFLNGGIIDGITYNGLSYTDGCGNDVKFKMSSSVNGTDNYQIDDIHNDDDANVFHVSWSQLVEMYVNNWGVYNHGLIEGSIRDPQISVVDFHNYIKSKTSEIIEGGIEPRIFVNPDGNDLFTELAFQKGYRICYIQNAEYGKPYFDVTTSWNKRNIRMGRSFSTLQFNMLRFVDELAGASNNGAHMWGSAFSHSVTNPDWGYDFSTFSNYMSAIADKYGKYGLDNIWMASEEEIFDYCILKDVLLIEQSLNGNTLQLTFSGNLPSDIRFYNTSIILNSSANISSIVIEGASPTSSFNGINSKTSLINIDCNNL